jgi:histidinol-phosphatase (PHP family)
MPFTANYHTHTFRCEHASGDCVEYAQVAARSGISILGFSDHTPLPDGNWREMRMSLAQLDDYEAAVQAARAAEPKLRIVLGLECEFKEEYHGWYRDEILGKRDYDYLIAGCHFTPFKNRWVPSFGQLVSAERLRAYANYTIQTMDSGLFDFITHPDIIGCSWSDWNDDLAACAEDICAASVTLQVPLELNSYGLRKPWVDSQKGPRPAYPWEPFWAIAGRHGVRVVLSSDAHQPCDVAAGYDQVAAIRDTFGLIEADLSYIGNSKASLNRPLR